MLTGIGGQGIQLAARTLAVAGTNDGLQAMMFGEYGGMMRGGNSDATVVLGTQRLQTPPTVPEAWGAVAMHHEHWEGVARCLTPGGVVVVDRSVFQGDLGRDDLVVVDVEATATATDLGHPQGASMVALGACASAAALVSLVALDAAAAEVLPAYRSQHAAANAEAMRVGFELVDGPLKSAWDEQVVRAAQ